MERNLQTALAKMCPVPNSPEKPDPCIPIPVVHSPRTAQGTLGTFTSLNSRVEKSDLEHWNPTGFSLLISLLETVLADRLQGKSSSRFACLHPQGHGVSCSNPPVWRTPTDPSDVSCETRSGKSIQRTVSVLVSEQHRCLGRPRHNRYVVGIWPRRRGFASALLKQWRYWWVLWKQASAGTYFSFNSVDIAVSVGTPLCYQSLNAFYSGVASVAQQRGQAEKFKPGGILIWGILGQDYTIH